MKPHKHVVHPRTLLSKPTINRKVAVAVASVLGSMWFFYFCVILDLAELPSVVSANSVELWVSYVAQTVIQLLALPILQVYQNIMQAQGEAKADADHHTLTYLATLQDDQMSELKNQTEILKLLRAATVPKVEKQ